MSLYYDRDGQPISREQWSAYFEDETYRRIGSTMVHHRYWVSTIWLGLDHGLPLPGYPPMPIIFETCIFDHHDIIEMVTEWHGKVHTSTHANSSVVERYTTADQARRGHRRWVRRIRKEEYTIS